MKKLKATISVLEPAGNKFIEKEFEIPLISDEEYNNPNSMRVFRFLLEIGDKKFVIRPDGSMEEIKFRGQ